MVKPFKSLLVSPDIKATYNIRPQFYTQYINIYVDLKN